MATVDLLTQVIKVAEEYLGPAADRFVKRQVVFHLKKQPQEISPADLPRLAEWTKTALGLLTEDADMVEDCGRKILRLAK